MTDVLVAASNRISHAPTAKLTVQQLLYVGVVHGFGSMLLSGGINFAIATAMYRWAFTFYLGRGTQVSQQVSHVIGLTGRVLSTRCFLSFRHSSHQVWLWKVSQNTLAGDAAVTVFVQVIVTWLIDAAMVCNDVKMRAYGIRPLTVSASALRHKFLHWYISVEGMELLEPHIILRIRVRRLIEGAIKALFLCVPVFLIWWPVAVAIMAGVGHSIGGGNYSYNHWLVCLSC